MGAETRREVLLAALTSGKRRGNIEKLLQHGTVQPNTANSSGPRGGDAVQIEDRPVIRESGSHAAEVISRPPPAKKPKTQLQTRYGDAKRRIGRVAVETTSGAEPPAQKPKTMTSTGLDDTSRGGNENDTDIVPAQDLCTLRECESWLDSPEAAYLLKDGLSDAKTTVQSLLVHPPQRTRLKAISG